MAIDGQDLSLLHDTVDYLYTSIYLFVIPDVLERAGTCNQFPNCVVTIVKSMFISHNFIFH